MTRLARLAAAALLLLAGGALAEARIASVAPVVAPPLALKDVSGREVDLADLRGRVVLVNFWATWCEPCRDEMPSLERLQTRLAGKPFEVLAVNYGEGVPRVADFLRKEKLSLTVLLDSRKEAAAAWKAGGLPMTFLIDARGRVRYSTFGERDWSEGESLRVVEGLVAEAPRAR